MKDADRHAFLKESRWLDEPWYLEQLQANPELQANADAPHGDLVSHYLKHGAPAGMAPNSAIAALQKPDDSRRIDWAGEPTPTPRPLNDPQLHREIALVAESGLFDPSFYKSNYGELIERTIEDDESLLSHFCRIGWSKLLKPNPGFDVWWYQINHLDPLNEVLNPFVHYLLIGEAAGYTGRPAYTDTPVKVEPQGQSQGQTRRVCLFAGYDAEGILDDYVVEYVRELARFADVYYLCDGYLPSDQLAKLDGIAKGAWAIRHGAYDFGSYSMLARDLVGWESIQTYDEMLLVNDSCYLLAPLDQVFSRMEASTASWWGLQATKGITLTQETAREFIDSPVPLKQLKQTMLPVLEDDPVYDFLIGSYFMAFRRPVIADPVFRRVLDTVHPLSDKLQIIMRYEIGLSHYLLGSGYDFDTFVPDLYPFHPVFTEWYFTLLEQGFPLLKKYLLYQNHYDVADLQDWKQRIQRVFPDAPVELFEKNLLRTAPADRLQRSFSIVTSPDGAPTTPAILDNPALRRLDRRTPTFDHWWAFPVSYDEHMLPANSWAILDAVREDPSIKKVVLTRSRNVKVPGVNIEVLPLESAAGQERLLRCGQVFMSERPRATMMRRPPDWSLHRAIIVRGGLTMQLRGYAEPALRPRTERVTKSPTYNVRALLTSSDLDQLSAVSVHYPATYETCWRTGLPMHDFLVRAEDDLPAMIREYGDRIAQLTQGRRLVLFAPARKRSRPRTAYPFTRGEVEELSRWARANDAVIGLREEPIDQHRSYRAMFGADVIDLSHHRFPYTVGVLRYADALLSDVSGHALDFLATGRPIRSFIHDHASIRDSLFYDPDFVFPTPAAHTFEDLLTSLESVFDQPNDQQVARYGEIQRLFFDHRDASSSLRVVNAVRSLHLAGDVSG